MVTKFTKSVFNVAKQTSNVLGEAMEQMSQGLEKLKEDMVKDRLFEGDFGDALINLAENERSFYYVNRVYFDNYLAQYQQGYPEIHLSKDTSGDDVIGFEFTVDNVIYNARLRRNRYEKEYDSLLVIKGSYFDMNEVIPNPIIKILSTYEQ